MTARAFLTFIIATVGLFSPILLSAKYPNGLASESVDPQRDSAAFAAMRLKMDEIRRQRPTVGLVLSGGGAKGAAEIGVIRYLEEQGIPVDLVVGTSMGSLIGGLYSVGYSANGIDSVISSLDWGIIMSDNPARHSELRPVFSSAQSDGYLQGDNVYGLLSALTAGYQDSLSFKELPIPYACVATDILTTKSINWCDGDLLDAMRSSMTLPVIFSPVRRGNRVMLDGGMRNVFPVDIARAMGADIIIGVDVSDKTKIEDLNDMAGLVVESLSSMGIDAYRENRKNTDVFIRPVMAPYGTMSWANADIDSLIQRGYDAALRSAPALDSVLALTGKCERQIAGKPARDLREKKVIIKSISTKGLDEKEKKYFSSLCHLKCGKEIPLAKIERTISDLYWTGAFKSITYRLLGNEEPYDLMFIFEKTAGSKYGVGLRIDTEEAVALLANASFFNQHLNGSHLAVNLKASMNPWAEVKYTYRTVIGPDLGVSSKIHYLSVQEIRTWHNDNKIFIQNPGRRIAYWRLGGRFQTYPNTFSVFGEIGCDTRDDKYFPTKGLKAKASFEFAFLEKSQTSRIPAFDICGAISFGEVFTIIPSLSSRITDNNSWVPIFMLNYIGGAMPGRYFEQQIPMISYDGIRIDDPIAALGALSLRFKIFKNFYLDGNIEGLALWGDSFWGTALRASYKTIAGPVTANLHWNSDTHTVGAYLGIGFDF